MAAKPRKGEKSQRTTEPVARITTFENKARLGADVPQLELPPTGFGQHLVDYLFEVGPSCGGEPLTYSEVAAWQGITGVRLDAWEAETLRRLSVEYLNERDAAADPERPAPYLPQT